MWMSHQTVNARQPLVCILDDMRHARPFGEKLGAFARRFERYHHGTLLSCVRGEYQRCPRQAIQEEHGRAVQWRGHRVGCFHRHRLNFLGIDETRRLVMKACSQFSELALCELSDATLIIEWEIGVVSCSYRAASSRSSRSLTSSPLSPGGRSSTVSSDAR